MTRLAGRLIALLCLLAAAHAASANTRYDPRLRFRTISTARFDIHYHQGEESLALRLAKMAEEVATTVGRTLGAATGRVQVILVDQHDLSNGWASPLPYNTIEISVAGPPAESEIGNTDDWLRLVFTHEYVHVVHLSRGQGWIGGLRRVFGRMPLLYPNLFQPIWQIEGIATWQESAQTGRGRVHAGDFRLLLDRAAAADRFDPLDRASSRLVDWPSGTTPYLYGGFFHQFLAEKYGEASLRRLTDETAGRLPYFGSPAFRKVFGKPLSRLWAEFEASLQRDGAAAAAEAERLTHHGFYVTAPRFLDDGRVLYSLADPHGFPSLMELTVATGRSRQVTDRYLGDRVAPAGPEVVFDQIEIARNVGLRSDLYAVDLGSGRTRRLTHGARAGSPDVSADLTRIVFTIQRADRRELATATLAAAGAGPAATLASAADVDFGSPRWSPDGTRIAAERRTRGASQIVVVDAASGAIAVVVPSGRNAAPVWAPDGSTIFFAAASESEPFRIHAVAAGGGPIRKLEGTGSSAQSPAVSPDGRSLVFVGYTADGYDLFRLPLSAARWIPVPPAAVPPETAIDSAAEPLVSRDYSPLPTILPRFWTPTFESDEGELVVGAATGSIDALGRHAYGGEAGWSTSRARPDWQLAYAYDRWRPTFYALVSDDTDPQSGGERRTLEADAGVLLITRRVRWSWATMAELHTSRETFACGADQMCFAPAQRIRRNAVRSGLSLSSARMFGYSISAEEGGSASATLESAHSPTFDGSSMSATIDARRYFRVWPHHAAIAVRGAAAGAWGDVPVRRVFSAAGSDPQSGGFRFGSDAVGLIRGLDEDRLFGHRAAVVNVDYRVPIAYVERGVGTLPIFLKAIHAAAFVDAGNAWTERFRSRDVRYSLGGELSFDTVVGYFAPITVSVGGAWLSSPVREERGFASFVRVGRAF
jgi:Tol biopolymer transport system component